MYQSKNAEEATSKIWALPPLITTIMTAVLKMDFIVRVVNMNSLFS